MAFEIFSVTEHFGGGGCPSCFTGGPYPLCSQDPDPPNPPRFRAPAPPPRRGSTAAVRAPPGRGLPQAAAAGAPLTRLRSQATLQPLAYKILFIKC